MERWNRTVGRVRGLYTKMSAIRVAGTIGVLAILVMPQIAPAQRANPTGNSSSVKQKPPTAVVPHATNARSRAANSPPATNPGRAKQLPGTGSAGQVKERPNDQRRVQLEPQKAAKQGTGGASNRQPQASSSNRTKEGNSSSPSAQPKRRVAASQKGQGNSGNARNSPNGAPGIAGAAKRKAASQAASDKAENEEDTAELQARVRAADQTFGLSPEALEAAQKKAALPPTDGNIVNRRETRVDQEIVVDVLDLDPNLIDSGHNAKDIVKTAADLATVGSSSDKITEESLKNGKRNLVKSELEKQLGLMPGVVEDATGSQRPLDPEELVDKAARAGLQGLPLTRGGFKDSEDLRTGRRTLEDVIANPSPDDVPPKAEDPPGGGINPDPKDSTPGNADDPLPDVEPGPTDPKDGPGDGSGDEIGNGSVGGNDPQPDIEPGPEDPNDGPGDGIEDGSGTGDDPQLENAPGPADPSNGPGDGGDSGAAPGTVDVTVSHTDDGGFDVTVTNNDTGESATEHFTPDSEGGYTGEQSDDYGNPDRSAVLPEEGTTTVTPGSDGEIPVAGDDAHNGDDQTEGNGEEEEEDNADTEEDDTDEEEDESETEDDESETDDEADADEATTEFTPAPDSDGTVVRDPALTERLRQRQRDLTTGSHPNGTPKSNPSPDSAGGEIVVPDLLLPAEENKSLRERLINPDPNAPALPRGQVRVNPKDVVGPKAGTINPGPEGNSPDGPQPESTPPIENAADSARDDGSSPDAPHDSGTGSSANEDTSQPATSNGSSDNGRATKAIDENSASEQLRRASNRMLKLLKIKSETQPTKPKPKTTQRSPSR